MAANERLRAAIEDALADLDAVMEDMATPSAAGDGLFSDERAAERAATWHRILTGIRDRLRGAR